MPNPGDLVRVVDSDGDFIAWGLFNPHSQIRVRLYRWSSVSDPDAGGGLDDDFWRGRVEAAVEHRRDLGLLDPEGACRLVFSEGDGLSGLTIDRYGAVLAVQFTSLALWQRQNVILRAIRDAISEYPLDAAVLRTEKGILEEEGLEIRDGMLFGSLPEGAPTIAEAGAGGPIRYGVDLRIGQKTGAYLDQRETRAAVAGWARDRDVADVCCYTGGFALHALAAGARSVAGVDVSAGALERARANAELNGRTHDLEEGRWSLDKGDAFRWLEARRDEGRRFGVIVLDPPRFARSSRGVPQALRGYASLNELAVGCLEPGGILVTCSCTGRVSRERFLSVLAGVEGRTGRRWRVLEQRGQPGDHPVSPTCPETAYLKCVVARIEG